MDADNNTMLATKAQALFHPIGFFQSMLSLSTPQNALSQSMLSHIARLLLAVLAALALAACGDRESNIEAGNREQILHWGNGSEPQELDPHIVTGVPEHHIIVALLEGLVAKDPATLEPIPAAAERWEVNAEGTVYTFYLRENARWSNGDPVTAEDFAWSWWRGLQPSLGNLYNYLYFPILNAEAYATGKLDDFEQVGVKALDAHTLQVTPGQSHPVCFAITRPLQHVPGAPRHD